MKEIERITPKEAFLKAFEEEFDNHIPKEWNSRQKDRVAHLTSNARTKTAMFTSIPMDCRGKDCVYANSCPLLKEDLAPVGHPCPIELNMVKHFMADYIQQMNVDLDNTIELSMVRDLIDLEVQTLRKTKMLAKEHFVQEYVIGMDPEGDPIIGKQLHLAIPYDAHIHKQKQQLLKVFLQTREAQTKAGVALMDSAQGMSNLAAAAHSILVAQDKALKAKLGIVERDEYIEADSTEE